MIKKAKHIASNIMNNYKQFILKSKYVTLKPFEEKDITKANWGKATSRMSAQSVAHLLMVLFIILGNISYYLVRRKNN